MSEVTVVGRLGSTLLGICAFLFSTAYPSAQAAQRTWTGLGSDALWSTAANWDSSVPTASDTALFSGDGNSQTAVTLGSGAVAAAINFASDAAAYTVGLASERLTLSANATLTLSAGSANNQSIPATLLVNGNLYVYNNESSKTLTLNYTNNTTRYIYVYGNGPVTFDTLRRPAGSELSNNNTLELQLRGSAPVTCTGPITLGSLWKDSIYSPSELILAPHTTNIICRDNWVFALSGATLSGGEGTVLRLARVQANVPAAIAIQTANPVTISCRLECPSGLATLNNGSGGWVRGTLILSYPDNLISNAVTFDRGNCIQVPSLAPNGTPNPLGACTNVNFTNPLDTGVYARLRVTGTGASASDKTFTVDKDCAVIENAGSGLLTLSGSFVGNGGFIFDGVGSMTLSGVCSTVGGLTKVGNGTLTLAAANTYRGVTTVNAGTLAITKGATASTNTISLAGGTTLSLNPAAEADFSLTLPAVLVTAPAKLVVAAPSSGSSTVTFPSLTVTNSATLSVTATDAGVSNRIFINGLAEGFVPWITLNGGLAAYSSTAGLIAYEPTSTSHIATLGPDSVIPDAATGAAVIDAEGTSGPITLASGLTSIALLSQEYSTDARADFSGGILAANMIRQISGAGALSLSNGFLTANGANSNACLSGIGAVSVVVVTNDEATGISSSKTYTHLLDFGTSTSNATINGVALSKVSTASGTVSGYGWSGFPAGGTYYNWTDWSNNIPVTAGVRNLLYDMVYSGTECTLKLTGLTLGATYEFRLYLRTWDGRASTIERTARFDFLTDPTAGPTASTTFDMNHALPSALVFRYVAASSELTIRTYCTANTSNPYPGFFGITNEKLADAPAGLATGRAALAFVTEGTAPVTVAAALTDNGRATAVTKEGDGTLTLSGPVSHTGATALNGGTLDLAPTSGVTQVFAAPIAGAGAIVKRDEGTTYFLSSNAYSGVTLVSGGTLALAHSNALGFASAGTLVLSNAALSLASAGYNTLLIAEPITFEGAGPDGLGALRNDSPSPQLYAFKNLTLSGPATVGGTAALSGFPYSMAPSASGRFDLRSGNLDFGGNTLTKAGPSGFFIVSSTITGVTSTAAIDITGGVLGLESTANLQGSENNVLSVRSGTSFDLYQLTNPIRWSLFLEDQSHLTSRGGTTNLNVISGPATLAGTAILDGSYYDTLSGTLSGSGGLLKAQGYTRLSGTNNLYAGLTTITNGMLFALTATTLPAADFSRVLVVSNGVLVVRPEGGDGQAGWANASIDALATSGAFPSRTAALGFETVYDDHAYDGSLPFAGVVKYGPRRETLSASGDLGPITVYEGELGFTTGTHNLGTNSIIVSPDSAYPSVATLHVSNASSLLAADLGYQRSGPLVSVGAASGTRGVLCLDDGAVAGRLYLGGGVNNAQGAVYQTGGNFLNTAGTSNDGRLGASGFGYYEIGAGTFTTKGYTQLGYNTNTVGILRQTGGSVVFNSGSTPSSAGTIGDYYGGNFAVRAGYGLFNLAGGTFYTGTAKLSLGEYDGVYTYSNGVGVLTIENDAYATVGYLEMANRNGYPLSVANLNGGTLAARYLIKGGSNSRGTNATALVSFNGGNLRITDAGSAVRTGTYNTAPVLAVCSNGASIEVDAAVSTTLDLPLDPPQGYGVTYIGTNSIGTGYIAPPFVYISGGGGTGATAIASINRTTGQLADIRVTSPGFGYTNAPTVTLIGGGSSVTGCVKDVMIGLSPATGGLTKRGDGFLTLTTNNSFRGAVTVAGGTLAARAPSAIPQEANLILNGGTLDLGGYTLTNASVTLSSGGSLINGSVVTTTLNKNDAGSADLTAAITLAPVAIDADHGTPGLYEGRLTNRLNRAEANPCWSVQLTTRAYNGTNAPSGGTINGCQWPDNTCYVYSGYLWNRTGTNVTWTFGENFDDNVYLVIDGSSILDESNASIPSYRNVQLTPGPHAFEVRCGQSGGTVGGNWVYSGSTYRIGFGVDFQGRAQNVADNYQPLTDPGDGSLLTVDLPACYTNAVVSSPADIPSLPSEVAANVGSLADGYALIYASDIPSSGGVINGTVAGTRYFTDNSLSDTNDFDRVAYYVELTHPTYGNQWVWVSFDAVTRDRTRIGYPWHDFTAGSNYCANIFQRKVSNMDVRSNVSTITNYTGCATGNIEFWPNDYGAGDYLGLGASTTAYDFGDAMSSYPLSVPSHGSFQVHNWGDKTTLFAMDNWGKANSTISLGIGNQPSGNPDWTFNYNGSAYTYRRLYVFTRDLVRTAPSTSAAVSSGTLRLASSTITHPVPAAIRAKVGTDADRYDVVYGSAVPTAADTIVAGTAYGIDNSSATDAFDRVAYYLELVDSSAVTQYVWVAFDPYTQDRTKLGYPSQSSNRFMWQQKVANMDVVCNVDGVTNHTGCATGNVEIWPSNYSNATGGLGLGGSGTAYDYDDSGASSNSNGHGCFQIHNWGDKTTLLAISHLGATGNQIGVGVGNNPKITNNDPDYTFSYNATQYVVRTFYVMVRPTSLGTGTSLATTDLSLAADATLDLGGTTQAIQSVTGSGTISNGVLSAGTVLSPAGDGVVGTLTLSGISFASGVQYHADLGDLLDVTGALDVSGMVIRINNPEDLDRSQAYTLIHTTGGVTGSATLETALPSGWKLLRSGNDLLLFSESGTLLKIK